MQTAEEHIHYWIIKTADGPKSKGRCKTCGESREFANFIEGRDWGIYSAAANIEQQRQRKERNAEKKKA